MYRMLIVDDEPAIVEGLGQLFTECGMELDVWQATSSVEALEVIRKMKVDILLSDIRMPEVNGLQLVDEVVSYWPSCRIIFLTGYSEFEYAYAAFQKNVAHYILKHEDDATLLAAVESVISKLEEEKRNGELLKQAMKETAYTQPLIKKQFLEALLLGESAQELLQQEPFSSLTLQLQLSMDEPVLLLAGFVKSWGTGHKLHTYYAIQRIFQSSLTVLLMTEELVHDNHALVWLIQPSRLSGRLMHVDGSPDWGASASYLKGILEMVQNACQETLGADVTFLLSGTAVEWEQLSGELELMRAWMRKRDWLLPNMAIIDLGSQLDLQLAEQVTRKQSGSGRFEAWLLQLEQALKEGDEERSTQLCRSIVADIREDITGSYVEGARKYLSFVLLYMTHVSNGDIPSLWEGEVDASRLFAFEVPDDWEREERYFITLIQRICAYRKEQAEYGGHALIEKIHQYIDERLGEDLSLITIADIAYMNPSYFSRYYKQHTGRNVSEYIQAAKLQASKQLLADPRVKVKDIAQQLGFASPSYFSIFFKKLVGITPQEYREQQ